MLRVLLSVLLATLLGAGAPELCAADGARPIAHAPSGAIDAGPLHASPAIGTPRASAGRQHARRNGAMPIVAAAAAILGAPVGHRLDRVSDAISASSFDGSTASGRAPPSLLFA